MDAELELEMAHGLGPSPRPPASSPGGAGRGPGGAGGGGRRRGPPVPALLLSSPGGQGCRGWHRGAGGGSRASEASGRDLGRFEPRPARLRFRGDPVTRGLGPARPTVPLPTPELADNPACPHPVPVRLGEPVAGQRLFNHQGLLGGGADHHRQPVRLHLPPLLLAGRLREVSPPQARGSGSLSGWCLLVGAT